MMAKRHNLTPQLPDKSLQAELHDNGDVTFYTIGPTGGRQWFHLSDVALRELGEIFAAQDRERKSNDHDEKA